MIRILHMIGALERGGSQALVMELYRNIDREKIQFDFVLDHPQRRDLAPEIEALGGRIYDMPGIQAGPAAVRRAWRGFLEEHREYSILHSHVRSYASFYLPVAKSLGLSTIIHSHSTSNGKGLSAAAKAALQFPLRYQADVLMSCSREAGIWLFGKKATESSRFFLLNNGIDLKRFDQSQESRQAVRHSLGIGGELLVGHVGRMHPAKNHAFLLAAFKELLSVRQDARLMLVGDGELRRQVEQQAAELGIAERCIFTGGRSDVPELMSAMDLLAFPSLWEGLPVTVIEAQAAGLPCLISDRINPAVDISPLVERMPIEDPVKWAEAMARPRQRMDVTEDIRRAGYDINESVQALSSLYESLWKER